MTYAERQFHEADRNWRFALRQLLAVERRQAVAGSDWSFGVINSWEDAAFAYWVRAEEEACQRRAVALARLRAARVTWGNVERIAASLRRRVPEQPPPRVEWR